VNQEGLDPARSGASATGGPEFTLGRLRIWPTSREVAWPGERRVLQPRTLQVLAVLAHRRGRVVSRDELIETCWKGRVVSEDAINRCIAALRRLAAASGAFGITTIYGTGYRLDENVQRPAAAQALRSRARLVGRTAELAELELSWAKVLKGNGALLAITGEPGVGKTRLAEEFAATATQTGALAVIGRCYDGRGSPPYGPFVEMLRSAAAHLPPERFRAVLGEDASEVARLAPELRSRFGDLAPPIGGLPGQEARGRLFHSLGRVLERLARQQPVLMIWEDIHWADESTLALLAHLAGRLDGLPILALATHRIAEAEGSAPFVAWWKELRRHGLAGQLALGPLDSAASEVLIRSHGGFDVPGPVLAWILNASEGNPFFIGELVSHLADERRLYADAASLSELEPPEGVRAVIARRLDRQSGAVRAALAAAAVIGRQFSVDLLERLGVGDAVTVLGILETAEAARLVEANADGYRFAHELIRQTLLAGLAPARRQRLHLRVAHALKGMTGHGGSVADVGYHLLAAGRSADPAQAARALLAGGRQALDGAAFEEALSHFQAGLTAAAAPTRLRAELLVGCGLARRLMTSKGSASVAAFREAVEIYRRLGDAKAMAETCLLLAPQLGRAGDFAGAHAVAEQGLKIVGPTPSALRAMLLGNDGYWRSLLGDFTGAAQRLADAAAIAELVGDRAADAHVAQCAIMCRWLAGDWRVLTESAFAALPLTDRDEFTRADVYSRLIPALWTQGRMTEAAALAPQALALAGRANLLAHFQIQANQGWAGLASGDGPGQFEAHARAFWRRCEAIGAGLYFSSAHAWLATAAWRQGDYAAALSGFEAALSYDHPGVFEDRGWAGLLLFKARTGDHAGATAMLDARPEALEPPAPGATHFLGLWERASVVVEALTQLQRFEEAAAFHPALAEYHGRGGVLRWLDGRLMGVVVALAAAAGGLWNEAERSFAAALGLADRLPHPIEQAMTREDWANALLSRRADSDRDRARALLAEAAERYEALGMIREAERVRRLISASPGLPAG
jgi:DNA-binding winged helix-turn-helix (wHTH) protein/tetratricopeptide (TPR) repeat protein